VIPPVPYEEKRSLEEGFLKTKEELPAFEEHEITEKTETITETKKFHQLPEEVIHKIIRTTCLIALILWFVLIIILSLITASNPFDALVGLSPVFLTIIVTYILVDKYHIESGILLVFPFVFTGILFMLGLAGLLGGIDYRVLSTVNIVFGLLFEIVIVMHYSTLRQRRRIKEKKVEKTEKKEKLVIKLDDEEGVKTFVSSIEDKSKAINAVIGRVYSVRHGGSEPLRKKIKVDAAHYNEFGEIKEQPPAMRKTIAVQLLKKIREKLELLDRHENEVFTKDELLGLLNLERDRIGRDKIINVLVTNDKDPVKAYYESALNFCNDAINQLEGEQEKNK